MSTTPQTPNFTGPEKSLLPNLVVFPGGGQKSKADKLLDQFCDVCNK